MNKGFTLMELVVVIAITAILSGIMIWGIMQYSNMGKDSNIRGSMVILVAAGETWYNGNDSSYADFCNPKKNNVIANAIGQMPSNPDGFCYNSSSVESNWSYDQNPAGLCCVVSTDNNAWAACAREFADKKMAFCVDSRGMKEEICYSNCSDDNFTQCPDASAQTNCQ